MCRVIFEYNNTLTARQRELRQHIIKPLKLEVRIGVILVDISIIQEILSLLSKDTTINSSKMRKVFLLIVICLSTFLSCFSISCRNKPNRNVIQFEDSTEKVENAIQELNRLMDSLITDKVTNYYFDVEGYLYINSTKLFLPIEGIDIDKIDSVMMFSKLKPNEISDFITNVLFLKKNFISGAHKDLFYGVYMYNYKATDDAGYDELRNIILVDKTSFKLPVSEQEKMKLLDQKGNLCLVSFIGTK